MNIQKAEIYKLYIPLQQPFRVSFGEFTKREIVFVKLFDKSGLTGIGESANFDVPVYEPDFNDATILLLKNFLLPRIINKDINDINGIESIFQTIRGNNFARVAIESAYWHLESQKQNQPLRKLWGGKKEKIKAAISIGLGTTLEDSIERVKRYIDQFKPKRAKIKIKPGIDVKLIEAIRNCYPDLPIFVDANSGYTLKDKALFEELDKYNLLMIEQPLGFNDLVDHATLQKQIKTPICLDESINGYHAAEQALTLGSCKIINIKPQRVGGYWQAKLISELAAKFNIPVWCGGMIESGWGQLFNCSIATLPNFTYENDICLTKWYLADDILETPILETDGIIDVGLTDSQFKIDEKKFTKYTVAKQTVS